MMRHLLAAAAAIACFAAGAAALAVPLSVRDSFRIGSSGTIFCSAQSLATDKAFAGMFDTGYAVTCRDAALPIGKLYKLREPAAAAARIAALRDQQVACSANHAGTIAGLGQVDVIDCRLKDADVAYRAYLLTKGNALYVAEGLAGYDSALQLGLRSIVADEPIKGEVSIATTGAGDPAAFARVQAGTLDPTKALAEAYRRNNSGSYAEAAEFFAAVTTSKDAPVSQAEALANEALQKSNLGRYEEANSLFIRAAAQLGTDPLVARRLRNYRAIHQLNQGDPDGALKELDKPVPKATADNAATAGGPAIDEVTAKRLNSESRMGQRLGGDSDLSPAEKAEILDGQALQLRGTSLRLKGNLAGATAALQQADAKLQAIRDGKVASIMWMRAQILGDLAAIAEDSHNPAEALRLYQEGVTLLETNYPDSAALLNAKARLAGYLARTGQLATAEAMFRDVVHSQPDTSNLPPSFAHVLRPYVDLLLKKSGDPAATAEIFAATQLMVRPGLAQTQAVLARELTGGTGEAARLFRQSVTLSRQVERARIELARLQDSASQSPDEIARARLLQASLTEAQKEQVATQSALGSFPRYRAVSSEVIALADLQKALHPGEAYYRMTNVGDHVYAILVTPANARAAKLNVTSTQLDDQVKALRETISTVENGQRITYPFDVALSHQLYGELFGPFAAEMLSIKHLIFEPDGAMLRLPPNLLVMDQASVDAYRKRAAAGGDAEFDFRGIAWLGRDRDVSTSVSPRSFAQLRDARPSTGTKEYLGLGQNTPPSAEAAELVPAAADRDCMLPMSSWTHPISAKELQVASGILQPLDPGGVQIVTGDNFTDTGIEARGDLDQYRIIHFATHGVVTARAAKCAAQPALLTSFGGKGSDGLLTFKEIFDLRLDADLVILSACDTAGQASTAATEQAGLATGGDVALDGLVRAFVGAGGRLVIASHWPVPDDYNATQRLITGLFSAPPGTPTVTALRLSERQLMDDANTSHPFYWSAFAAVGDGEIPVIRTKQQIAEAK
ncbi:MAG TPA: CHAT domain-containing tetratricopeptide repeat protein [Sphingomicrobium sp.]|nr:CHAT domain-containing tetratricopeptide repeat protein [Sphingomicrobium sp.]